MILSPPVETAPSAPQIHCVWLRSSVCRDWLRDDPIELVRAASGIVVVEIAGDTGGDVHRCGKRSRGWRGCRYLQFVSGAGNTTTLDVDGGCVGPSDRHDLRDDLDENHVHKVQVLELVGIMVRVSKWDLIERSLKDVDRHRGD